jgi:alcohol dehydrogenase (NADP+)
MIRPMLLFMRRRSIRGSFIGSIARTQEMLDFCQEKGIRCDVEVIDASQVNTAVDRIVAGDVHFRFVIDMLAGLINEQ